MFVGIRSCFSTTLQNVHQFRILLWFFIILDDVTVKYESFTTLFGNYESSLFNRKYNLLNLNEGLALSY